MSPPDNQSGNGRPSQWMKSNLVALGSAAVLVVYSAGYAKTRSAAERFSDEANDRRSPARRAAAVAPAAAPHAVVEPVAAHADSSPTTSVAMKTDTPRATPVEHAPKSAAAPVTVADNATHAASTADTATSSPAAKIAEPMKAAPAASATPAPVVATPTAPAPTPAPADTATKSADTAHVQLKDGTFSGWGTSRHGDIEAAVQIKDGKIASAFIVQCLTRYSCSWISMLPGQVVTRQSAEVDYVTGATQSSNAFYYAITEALNKAK